MEIYGKISNQKRYLQPKGRKRVTKKNKRKENEIERERENSRIDRDDIELGFRCIT